MNEWYNSVYQQSRVAPEKADILAALTAANTSISTGVSAMNSDLRNKQLRRSEPFYWNDFIEQTTGRVFDWCCPFCGIDISHGNYHKAHINPVGTGVGVIPGNIVLACVYCNQHMHQRHAQKYCADKNISFWQIQFKCELLAKVFPLDMQVDMQVSIPRQSTLGHTKQPDATEKVKAYLLEFPEAINMKPLELASMLGVGKSTVYNVIKAMKQNLEVDA